MTDLTKKHCVPCEGGACPLPLRETKTFLAQVNPAWQVKDAKAIERTFTFKDFLGAVAFINQVADIAEKEGHHPDMNLHGWNKVTLNLSTHAIGGLSENDFILASKVDELVVGLAGLEPTTSPTRTARAKPTALQPDVF